MNSEHADEQNDTCTSWEVAPCVQIDNTAVRLERAEDVIETAALWLEQPGGAGVVWMASMLRAVCKRSL